MTDHTPNSKVSRLEVVSTGARRRWTLEEKQRIVAESYVGRRLVSVTARRNGWSASQLFTWRRLAREDRLSGWVPALVLGDRLYAGSGLDVETAAAVVASCAARKSRNDRD